MDLQNALKSLSAGRSATRTRLSLDETLDALRTMGIGNLTLKDVHLPLTSTPGERASVRKKVERAGVRIFS